MPPRTLARTALTCLALFLLASISAHPGDMAPAASSALEAIEARSTGQVKTTVSPTTGLATFLSVAETRLSIGLSGTASAPDRAQAFLRDYGKAFGVSSPEALRLAREPRLDWLGMEHVRFDQTHEGIAVTGGEITIHLRGDAIVAVNARIVAELESVAIQPTVTAAEALDAARELIERTFGRSDFSLSSPRLEVFNRGHLEGRRTPSRLAWFVEVRAFDLRQYLWIDAETGGVLLRFSQLAHTRDRRVYDAASGSALPGTLVCGEGDPPTGDVDIDRAYEYSGDTWDYFWSEHGRDSYDDNGATLVSSVDYCPSGGPCPFTNAFWNGSQMVYGEGFPAADDVAAHEITHAVIEHTADFFYYMQSGALSESYADLFGETVDLANGAGTDTPEVRWLLGEDRPCGAPDPADCASRSMIDPTLFGDPAKTSDWRFVCEDPGDDGGGLHSNSGVANHAFALAVDGGTFNGETIIGIGLAKAGAIYYRALAHYLLSASNFVDHDDAVHQACQDLLGIDGIAAADCQAVDQALNAVELGQPWPCEPLSPTAGVLCGEDKISVSFFYDDFENGPGIWSADTSTSTLVGENVWGLGHDFATSGSSHLRGDLLPQCDPEAYDFFTDSAVEMTSDVWISEAGAYLQFSHAFGFENFSEFDPHEYYDGGVLEYSVNHGISWSDAGHLISAGSTYGGVIDPDFGNPLGGQEGFVGDSWGYTSTQADLGPLAAQSVRFRFRIGTDDTTDFCDYGWFVDDVRVFLCPSSCLALPESGCLDCTPSLELLSEGSVRTVETWVGCDSITAGSDFGIGDTGRVSLIAPVTKLENGFFVSDGGELTIIDR